MTEEDIQAIKKLREHNRSVGQQVIQVCNQLIDRALIHDDSIFTDEDLKLVIQEKKELMDLVAQGYSRNSPQQQNHRKKWKPLLGEKHYSLNRHHIQYHDGGINGMNLIDLIEMLCDWYVATKENNRDIDKSIRENVQEHKIDSQLSRILKNTVREMKEIT